MAPMKGSAPMKSPTPLLKSTSHDMDGLYPIPSTYETQTLVIVPTQRLKLDFSRISRVLGRPKFYSLGHEMLALLDITGEDDRSAGVTRNVEGNTTHRLENVSTVMPHSFPDSIGLQVDEPPHIEAAETCTVNPFARMTEVISTQLGKSDNDINAAGIATAYLVETVFPTVTDRLIVIRGPVCIFNATTLQLNLETNGNSYVCSNVDYLGRECPFDPSVYCIPPFDPSQQFSPSAFASLQPSDRNLDRTVNIAISLEGYPMAPLTSFVTELLEVTPQHFVWSRTRKRVTPTCIATDVVLTPSAVLRNTTPLPIEVRIDNWCATIPSDGTHHFYHPLHSQDIQFRFTNWEWSSMTPLPMLHCATRTGEVEWASIPQYVAKSKRHAKVLVILRACDSVVVFGCPSWATLQRTTMALGDLIELQNREGKLYPKLREEISNEDDDSYLSPVTTSRTFLKDSLAHLLKLRNKRAGSDENVTQCWILDGSYDNSIVFHSWDNAVRIVQAYWRERKTKGYCRCVRGTIGSQSVHLPLAKALLAPQLVALPGKVYGFSYFPLSVSSSEMPDFAGSASVESTLTMIQPGIQITNCLETDLFLKQVDQQGCSVGMTLIAPGKTQPAWLWLQHKTILIGDGVAWSAPLDCDLQGSNLSAGHYSLAIPVKHGEPTVWGLLLSDTDGVLSLQVKPCAFFEVCMLPTTNVEVEHISCTTDTLAGTTATFSRSVAPLGETSIAVGYFMPFRCGRQAVITLTLPKQLITVRIDLDSHATFCVLRPYASNDQKERNLWTMQVRKHSNGVAICEIGSTNFIDYANTDVQLVCGHCSSWLLFGEKSSTNSADFQMVKKSSISKLRILSTPTEVPARPSTLPGTMECQNPACQVLLYRPSSKDHFKVIAHNVLSRVRTLRSSRILSRSPDTTPRDTIAEYLFSLSWLNDVQFTCTLLLPAVGVSVISKTQSRELCYLTITAIELTVEIPQGCWHSHRGSVRVGAIRLDSQLRESMHQTVLATIANKTEVTAIELVAHRVYVRAPGLFFKHFSFRCSHVLEVCLDDSIISALSNFAAEVSKGLRQRDTDIVRTKLQRSAPREKIIEKGKYSTPEQVALCKVPSFVPPTVPRVLNMKEFHVTTIRILLWCSLRLDRLPGLCPVVVARAMRSFTLWDAAVSVKAANVRMREQTVVSWEGSLGAFGSMLLNKYLFRDLVRVGILLLGKSNVFNLAKSPMKTLTWGWHTSSSVMRSLISRLTGSTATKKMAKGPTHKDAPIRPPRILMAAKQLIPYYSTLLPQRILEYQHVLRSEQSSVLDGILFCATLTSSIAIIVSSVHIAFVDLSVDVDTRVLGFFVRTDMQKIYFQETLSGREIVMLHKNGQTYRWKLELAVGRLRVLQRTLGKA